MTSRLVRRSRSIVAALAAIAVSAGVVAAARPASMPAAATDGLDRAAAAAGQTVPVTPTAPRFSGWFHGRLLLPAWVSATGMPCRCAKAASASQAWL